MQKTNNYEWKPGGWGTEYSMQEYKKRKYLIMFHSDYIIHN
jgi:hypothetical protein